MALRIGIVVGMAAEARIARRLNWLVSVGGGTAAGADAATRSLLNAGATALVSLGVAGGLDPSLRPGDIVVPETVLTLGTHYPTDPMLSRTLGGVTPHCLCSGDAIVATCEQKTRLWRQTGAAAVDLESGIVARIATENGLPFAIMRAICDPAERPLPWAARNALDAHGGIAVRRILMSLMIQPAQLPALLALAADAAAARRALLARVSQIARHGLASPAI